MGLWESIRRWLSLEVPEHLQRAGQPPRARPATEASIGGRRRTMASPPRRSARPRTFIPHGAPDPEPRRPLLPGLPPLNGREDLAAALQMEVRTLNWLVDPYRLAAVRAPHYTLRPRWKSDGRLRVLLAPRPQLKAAQRWILHQILDRVPLHDAAHGFVRGRSPATNASRHVGRGVVLRFDFQDFFQQFTHQDVARQFSRLGYPRSVARDLAFLTTAPVRQMLPRLLADWNAEAGNRPVDLQESRRATMQKARGSYLPCLAQGAPTSPALANLCCRRLDQRLEALARHYGATYTRYADDLSFSGDEALRSKLCAVIPLVGKIARQQGLLLNEHKRHITRRGGRQIVTGLVVNQKVGVPALEVRRLRAVLHNCRTRGPASQNRDGHADFRAHLAGRIGHVCSADPAKGRKLLAAFREVDWSAS